MFILIFFIVVSMSQFINNKVIGLSDDSEDSYDFSKKDSIIIAGLFLLGIILQIFSKIPFISNFYWFICLAYLLGSLITITIVLQLKKTSIIKKREEMQQVYEILQKLVDKKGEGLDFNNPPFSLFYKYGNIQHIQVQVEPTQFSSDPEKMIMPFIPQLNAFLPTYNWNYELHLEQRYIDFIGDDKPPQMVRWPGSWLRYFRFMPMGVSGKGEVGFKPDSVPKDAGRSQYIDESGNPISGVLNLPNAPQGMISGAPLSLNTIVPTTDGYKTISTLNIGDKVFDIKNNPVAVIGKSEIKYNEEIYKLTFKNTKSNKKISIKSDKIHKFPKIINDDYIVNLDSIKCISVNNIRIGDYFIGNNKSKWKLIQKTKITSEPVQCILVNSPNHLFLITSIINKYWTGGLYYPYDAIYTRNTGGGKSVAVQNVLLHCLEHNDKISVGLIDPKNVEFSAYKGMKGVVGVATNTLESVEMLRIARQVMLKRNKEMAKLGIKNIGEYSPTKKTDKVFITGREYNEDDMIKVKIDGQEQQMSAKELVEYLHND